SLVQRMKRSPNTRVSSPTILKLNAPTYHSAVLRGSGDFRWMWLMRNAMRSLLSVDGRIAHPRRVPMTRIVSLAVLLALSVPAAALAQTPLRVATCAGNITTGLGAAVAVAQKLGWFKAEVLDVEVLPLPGSTDCVKSVA